MGIADSLLGKADGTTIAILNQIESLGFVLLILDEGREVSAYKSGVSDRFRVQGEDAYVVACELAKQTGIDLVDG